MTFVGFFPWGCVVQVFVLSLWRRCATIHIRVWRFVVGLRGSNGQRWFHMSHPVVHFHCFGAAHFLGGVGAHRFFDTRCQVVGRVLFWVFRHHTVWSFHDHTLLMRLCRRGSCVAWCYAGFIWLVLVFVCANLSSSLCWLVFLFFNLVQLSAHSCRAFGCIDMACRDGLFPSK